MVILRISRMFLAPRMHFQSKTLEEIRALHRDFGRKV